MVIVIGAPISHTLPTDSVLVAGRFNDVEQVLDPRFVLPEYVVTVNVQVPLAVVHHDIGGVHDTDAFVVLVATVALDPPYLAVIVCVNDDAFRLVLIVIAVPITDDLVQDGTLFRAIVFSVLLADALSVDTLGSRTYHDADALSFFVPSALCFILSVLVNTVALPLVVLLGFNAVAFVYLVPLIVTFRSVVEQYEPYAHFTATFTVTFDVLLATEVEFSVMLMLILAVIEHPQLS